MLNGSDLARAVTGLGLSPFLPPDFLRLRLFLWRNAHRFAHRVIEFSWARKLHWFCCGHRRMVPYCLLVVNYRTETVSSHSKKNRLPRLKWYEILFSTIMNATDLEQYKAELIAEHQAEIAAIDRLIARERNKPQGSFNGSTAIHLPTTERVRHRRSAASIVKEATMQLNGKFTRKHVASSIAEHYPNSPLATRTVAVELWKLARAGEIETVEEGRGRTPAMYKRK
jgi:hypothetical protein